MEGCTGRRVGIDGHTSNKDKDGQVQGAGTRRSGRVQGVRVSME